MNFMKIKIISEFSKNTMFSPHFLSLIEEDTQKKKVFVREKYK